MTRCVDRPNNPVRNCAERPRRADRATVINWTFGQSWRNLGTTPATRRRAPHPWDRSVLRWARVAAREGFLRYGPWFAPRRNTISALASGGSVGSTVAG